MRLLLSFIFFLITHSFCLGQDTLYARQVIKSLTSKKCFGRGYVNKGLQNAELYLVGELKKFNTTPLFDGKYTQSFYHNVNTFPKDIEVKVNGKKLKPGVDFIPSADCAPAKGKFILQRADSVTFFNMSANPKIGVSFKDKLTFTVAKTTSGFCSIEIDRKRFNEEIKEIELKIDSRLVNDFESRNIGCFINGTSSSDTTIIFTAHYDHLGGIGKTVFFPGANDNASGTSVILNLIKYYSTYKPKYKTVFIFFAGEEAGLLGSKHFVEGKTLDLKKIKFLVNLDLLGTGDDGIMVVNGAVYESAFHMLSNINSQRGLVKEVKRRGKAANSDHYWFSEAGVPCFFIYTLGGTTSYHDVFDTAEQLPLTDYVDVFRLIVEFATRL